MHASAADAVLFVYIAKCLVLWDISICGAGWLPPTDSGAMSHRECYIARLLCSRSFGDDHAFHAARLRNAPASYSALAWAPGVARGAPWVQESAKPSVQQSLLDRSLGSSSLPLDRLPSAAVPLQPDLVNLGLCLKVLCLLCCVLSWWLCLLGELSDKK